MRDWRIYFELAQRLIFKARALYVGEDFGVELANTVYALDATTIDLCLSMFIMANDDEELTERFNMKVAPQIQADRDIARKADRAYVIGGPGARQFDDDKNEIGIVSTAMNTGKTPGFAKRVCWGICSKDDWPTIEKSWPEVRRRECRDWAEVLLPQMGPSERYLIEFTRTIVPFDGKNYVCYGTIVYTTVFGDEVTTSWKHLVRPVVEESDGKVRRRLETIPLPGGYSSEWESSASTWP